MSRMRCGPPDPRGISGGTGRPEGHASLSGPLSSSAAGDAGPPFASPSRAPRPPAGNVHVRIVRVFLPPPHKYKR